MKKFILSILLLVILGCSIENITPNLLQEESRLNTNDYKGNFVILNNLSITLSNEDYILEKINYLKPSLSINENGKGFINSEKKIIFISKTIPTKITFNLNLLPYTIYFKINDNGDGVAILKQISNNATGIIPVFVTTFIKYQPTYTYIDSWYQEQYTSSVIDQVSYRDYYKIFNYLSDFELDEKGNGLVIYPTHLHLQVDNDDIPNTYKTIEIKNYKPLKETLKKTNSSDLIQVVRKKDSNFSVFSIPFNIPPHYNLTNKPNIDENGNGVITYSENNGSLFVQKVISYKSIDEPIQLLKIKRNSIDCKINLDGNGFIIYTDSEIEDKNYRFGKLYFSEVKNFKVQERKLISNSENCVNGVIDFNSKGNGLIVWQDGSKLYGRRLENYKML
jgi:hypothetical protein